MAKITEQMVRSRSEHNECEITTLEELSLHQQDIERIEHLDRWCKHLKILYLQSNLISKIENVGRLKELEYLNLALNNVTRIENLQRCESLQKLDLTVNFVGDLLSIKSLQTNVHLEELFLTGNPCTDYKGYRDYVIATLPQLKWLDGKEILRSDRIVAMQQYAKLEESIRHQQGQYEAKLLKEKEQEEHNKEDGAHTTVDMDEAVPYTPDSRTALHKELSEKRKEGKSNDSLNDSNQPKKERKLERDGKMLNVNEGRYEFSLDEDEVNQCFILDVSCPRFMDTSLIDCDLQPSYVRVTIKGKILQLVLPEEVSPDSGNAVRSKVTGHLVVTMPKANPSVIQKPNPLPSMKAPNKKSDPTESSKDLDSNRSDNRQYLEVKGNILDIVKDDQHDSSSINNPKQVQVDEVKPSDDFIDDPDVPPLI